MMDYAISARYLLDTVTDGHVMRKVIGFGVQTMGFAVGLGLLLSWVGLWSMVGTLELWGNLALTATQIVLLGAIIKVVQVMYVRGDDIRQLPDSDFTMMSIFATLVRLPGEAALAFFTFMSIPALLLVWSGAGHIISLFGVPVLNAHWGISGVVAMTTCWIIGFTSFVAFALVSEIVSALFNIAHDLRCTRRCLESNEQNIAMNKHSYAA